MSGAEGAASQIAVFLFGGAGFMLELELLANQRWVGMGVRLLLCVVVRCAAFHH